jgi:hypothetical protein
MGPVDELILGAPAEVKRRLSTYHTNFVQFMESLSNGISSSTQEMYNTDYIKCTGCLHILDKRGNITMTGGFKLLIPDARKYVNREKKLYPRDKIFQSLVNSVIEDLGNIEELLMTKLFPVEYAPFMTLYRMLEVNSTVVEDIIKTASDLKSDDKIHESLQIIKYLWGGKGKILEESHTNALAADALLKSISDSNLTHATEPLISTAFEQRENFSFEVIEPIGAVLGVSTSDFLTPVLDKVSVYTIDDIERVLNLRQQCLDIMTTSVTITRDVLLGEGDNNSEQYFVLLRNHPLIPDLWDVQRDTILHIFGKVEGQELIRFASNPGKQRNAQRNAPQISKSNRSNGSRHDTFDISDLDEFFETKAPSPRRVVQIPPKYQKKSSALLAIPGRQGGWIKDLSTKEVLRVKEESEKIIDYLNGVEVEIHTNEFMTALDKMLEWNQEIHTHWRISNGYYGCHILFFLDSWSAEEPIRNANVDILKELIYAPIKSVDNWVDAHFQCRFFVKLFAFFIETKNSYNVGLHQLWPGFVDDCRYVNAQYMTFESHYDITDTLYAIDQIVLKTPRAIDLQLLAKVEMKTRALIWDKMADVKAHYDEKPSTEETEAEETEIPKPEHAAPTSRPYMDHAIHIDTAEPEPEPAAPEPVEPEPVEPEPVEPEPAEPATPATPAAPAAPDTVPAPTRGNGSYLDMIYMISMYNNAFMVNNQVYQKPIPKPKSKRRKRKRNLR